MKIKILTLFPEMFESVLNSSILGRAIRSGILEIETVNIRDYTLDKHRNTDDYPFGGGAGMVMAAQPVIDAVNANSDENTRRVYMSPRGKTLTQEAVENYAKYPSLLFLCGHYEGVDQRALDTCIDEELSIGDYVLTGGELGAMVAIDAIARMIPGVLGCDESGEEESFSMGLLEYPQYTRPAEYLGMRVPEVLLGGNHADIVAWRRQQSLKITYERRPDLLASAPLSDEDHTELERIEGAEKIVSELKTAGVTAVRLSLLEEAAFPAEWIEHFIPEENRRNARRQCTCNRKHTGRLYQAFERGYLDDIHDLPDLQGAGILYIDNIHIAFTVDHIEHLPQKPYYVIVNSSMTATAVSGKSGTHHAVRTNEVP